MNHNNDGQIDFRDLPIYKKAVELFDIVDRLLEHVEREDLTDTNEAQPHKDLLKHYFQSSKEHMLANALIIPTKIAGAHGINLYDIKMESAALIRKVARELITDARGLQMIGYRDTEYLDVLRKEVDEFRIVFAQWVAGFDNDDYIIDRWGLFNPPGVNYDDVDPDDDLPFNPVDFMDDGDDMDD
jgi:hypothetical protein